MPEPVTLRPSLQEQFPNLPDQEPLDERLIPSVEEIFAAASIRRENNEPSDIERAITTPNHRDLSKAEIIKTLQGIRQEMILFERAARSPDKWHIPDQLAKEASLIVRFSAPGTYYQPKKNDRYFNLPWASNMDRIADDIAARMGVVVAGKKIGQDFSVFGHYEMLKEYSPLDNLRATAHHAIHAGGLQFVYVGRPDESEAVRRVLKTPSSFIPENCVSIITGPEIDNTLDQVASLKRYLGEKTFLTNSTVTVVDFAPRLVRITRKITEAQAIPPTLRLALFPIATPNIATNELPLLEARGTLAYIIRNQAAIDHCPAIVFGTPETLR